jgi:hypothetical protein
MGGTPEKIKAGNVMKLPPPATELSAPPRIAEKKRVRPVKYVIFWCFFLYLRYYDCSGSSKGKVLGV